MASTLNIAAVMGRLTRPIELKTAKTGVTYCEYTLACPRPKQKDNINWEEADFIDCVTYRKSAEYMAKYCLRGDLIAVSGKIRVQKYKTKDNEPRTVVQIVTNHVSMVNRPVKNRTQQTNTNAQYPTDEVPPLPDDNDMYIGYDPNDDEMNDLPF